VKIDLCFFLFFFVLQHKNSSQSQSSYNNNSKTRNQILQSLPAVRSTATANRQQLASFEGPMKAKQKKTSGIAKPTKRRQSEVEGNFRNRQTQ
jgi:hypothetical protein